MNYKLHQKAYLIELSKIDEGYCYDTIFVNAKNRYEAQKLLFEKAQSEGITTLRDGREIEKNNIPICRYPEQDLFKFEDQFLSIRGIKELIEKRKRSSELEDILNDSKITHCYIKKRGSYYCDDYCGYTERITYAGIYLKSQAISHAKGCDELSIIPIDNEQHNKTINEEIEYLKTKIIITI